MAKPEIPLVRLLNAPDLPAIVPRLQPEVLHRVIHTYGLEDCTELVALATPAQLARVLDLDLWRAGPPGADERFDADRFGVWLAVLLDAGPEVAADKLEGLDLNLVVAGFARHIVVSDHAAVAAYTMLDGTRVPGIPPRGKLVSEIGGYTVESRRASAWEAIGELLSYLAAEHGALFHRIMRGCVRLSNGATEEDAFHSLLHDAEQHVFDLAYERERRRERQGYVTPAQAHAFLQSARALSLDGDRPRPSPIARAHFTAAAFEDAAPPIEHARSDARVEFVLDGLREAGALPAPRRALPDGGSADGSEREWIASYVASHAGAAEELAYLANAIVAGCSVQGRAFTEREAGDAVLAVCNLGLENWPPRWQDRDLVTAFQVGWAILHREVCVHTAERLVEILADIGCADRETWFQLDSLRRELSRHLANGEPWRARDALDIILALDGPAWAALLGIVAECPVLHAALDGSRRRVTSVSATAFTFIARNSDIAVVRAFVESLPVRLAGA